MKINWKFALSGLLALLGFGGCDRFAKCMYGQPTANYKFLGDVKDESGNAIPGIRVVFLPNQDVQSYENDTLYTDQAGHFEKDRLIYNWPDASNALVKFEDVDGADNGLYQTKVLQHSELDVKQTKKSKDTWYKGDFTIEANAVLKKED